MVGENGPELFTPSQAGRIIPNHRVGAGGGGGGAIVVQQTNNFSSGIQGVQLASMLEQSRRATIAEIQSLNQRRKVRFA
jgi:glycerate kinase